ncbi:MAG: hypothetical protein FJ264_17570 [Planctomycetes bacterium]|nr:hypothetical protein [Planctomycetota bacterium]
MREPDITMVQSFGYARMPDQNCIHTFKKSNKKLAGRRTLSVWNMLKTGKLSNAANLTDDNQIASVSRWLCNL